MKRIVFIVLSSLLSLTTMWAEQADVHRFANYNIRYVNANNGDTGDKLWANRRQYVAQIVRDYDFDIVGLDEVTGNNSDPTTGKSQLQDMQDMLPGYTMIAYERENRKYSYTGLMYKTSRYECLNHVSFWISQTPWQVSKGWTADENIYRRCVMAHFRVRNTGEEFWFCSTHCNYGPSECAIQGAKLVAQMVRDSARNLPVVLVGDFNMVREVHTDAYRGYASMLNDAALEVPADQNYCLPTTNPQITNTGNNWIPVTQSGAKGSEFDYIFYHNMTPLSRHIITEYYGRSVNPSDHYPLLVRFRLGSATRPTHHHAANEAELRQALQEADVLDTICMPAGTIALTAPILIPTSVTLVGGYNADYSQVTGMTHLTLQGASEPMFRVDNYYTLQLRNIFLETSDSQSANGGLIQSAGSQLRLWNCRLSGSSTTAGGAIYASTDSVLLYGCQFLNCSSRNGGAVYANIAGELRVMDSYFSGNIATESGAAIMAASYKTINIQRSSFVENESTRQGTVYAAPSSIATSVNLVNCSFLNNRMEANKGLATMTKKFGGTAVNAALSSNQQAFNMAHCTLIGNTTSFTGTRANIGGGALTVSMGQVCLMNNLMFSNPLTLQDGTMEMADCYVSADASIFRNTMNLTSDSASIAGWELSADSTIAGTLSDGVFQPQVDDAGCYQFLRRKLGNKDLKYLTTMQRLCENAFGFDINGDGILGGYLTEDQRGDGRPVIATVGALEYSTPSTGFADTPAISDTHKAKYIMIGGHLYLSRDGRLFTLDGRVLL